MKDDNSGRGAVLGVGWATGPTAIGKELYSLGRQSNSQPVELSLLTTLSTNIWIDFAKRCESFLKSRACPNAANPRSFSYANASRFLLDESCSTGSVSSHMSLCPFDISQLHP